MDLGCTQWLKSYGDFAECCSFIRKGFAIDGQSSLVDRLVKLSPTCGIYLLILLSPFSVNEPLYYERKRLIIGFLCEITLLCIGSDKLSIW